VPNQEDADQLRLFASHGEALNQALLLCKQNVKRAMAARES